MMKVIWINMSNSSILLKFALRIFKLMLSKACQYAIRAALYLAIHSSETQKVGVKEMASSLEIPQHFLGKTLQQLARYHLISSVKGPNGGLYLIHI